MTSDDLQLRAEMQVLGTLLEYPAAFSECLPLGAADFTHPGHRRIFAVMLALSKASKSPGLLAVCERLRASGPNNQPFIAYAQALCNQAQPPAIAAELAAAMHERGLLRAVRTLHAEMGERILADDPGLLVLARQMGVLASGQDELSLRSAITPAPALVQTAYEYVESIWNGEQLPPVPLGLETLDHLGACMRGELMIIGARPSSGKTTMGVQYALSAARAGYRALIVSLEMSESQLTVRMFAQEARVNIALMRPTNQRGISESDRGAVLAAAGQIEKLPFGIVDRGTLDIESIVSLARGLAIESGLGLLVIDYIQLIPTPLADTGRATRTEELGKISRKLKLLARELNIAVIALAQLRRGAAGVRPRLPDLRESGDLEQNADSVLFLSPDLSREDELSWEARPIRPVYCDLAKNRNGPRGSTTLMFNTQAQLFTEAAL